MGDSQLIRYQKFLQATMRDEPLLRVRESFCISGATIADFKKALKASHTSLPSDSIILICLGTNDITRNTPFGNIKNQFLSLIRLIKRRYAPKLLLILTLPPFLRFTHDDCTLKRIDDFNRFLTTIQSHCTQILRLPVTVHNAAQFCESSYYPSGRKDGIHLNVNAFSHLTAILKEQFNNRI